MGAGPGTKLQADVCFWLLLEGHALLLVLTEEVAWMIVSCNTAIERRAAIR